MTNNTPDYKDNLVFLDCKNCKMTDEYCASGDCPHDKTNYDTLKDYEAHGVPVPSYEEWKAKLEQNAQLKELLKEIRDSIAESQLKLTPEGFKLITEIVAKIDEALR